MSSTNLAQLGVAVATVAAIAVPLILAASSLVFQMIVQQAASLSRSALQITADAMLGFIQLGDLEQAFRDDDYTGDEFVALLQAISRADFHPRRFESATFRETFQTRLAKLQHHLKHLRETRLEESRRRLADQIPEGRAYAEVMPRLDIFFVPTQAMLESFDRQVALYDDLLQSWRILKRDLLVFAIPAAILVGGSLLISVAAWTYTPTVIDSSLVNLIVAALIVGLLFGALLWVANDLMRIARKF